MELSQYLNHDTLSYDEFTHHVRTSSVAKAKKVSLPNGHKFKLWDNPVLTLMFWKNSNKCVNCGLEVSVVRLHHFVDVPCAFQKGETVCHKQTINIYGIDENNNPVLFTKDHIIPKSKGGRNIMQNYQLMCSPCNNSKASTLPTEAEIAEVKRYEHMHPQEIRILIRNSIFETFA